MIKIIAFTITIISAICGILSYICGFIAPSYHYIFGLISLSAPLWLVINVIALPYWLFKKWKNLFFPILSLLICFPLLQRSYKFKSEEEKPQSNTISVLNYNTYVFGVYDEITNSNIHYVNQMTNYLLNSNTDILCLNEYYNQNDNSDYNVKKALSTKYPYHYINLSYVNSVKHEFGQAIFSKFPIINKQLLNQKRGGNFTIYVDIKSPNGKVRVYCTHLASMSLPQNINKELQKDEKSRNVILGKFARGFQLRTKQVQEITASIKECKTPIILTGDFNDTPYSYAYTKLSNELMNSFEISGSGFGFTYNSSKHNPWLYPLRIDNQFYSDQHLSCFEFSTDNSIRYSDHFPSIGRYNFRSSILK